MGILFTIRMGIPLTITMGILFTMVLGIQFTVSTLMLAYGINREGKREILAIEPMYDESEASWREFFRKLKNRGVGKICLCVSDAHLGIQNALRKEWIGSSWQRCKVHFMRNIMARVPHRDKAHFAERLKQIWLQPDKTTALSVAGSIIDDYGKRFPEAKNASRMDLKTLFSFMNFPTSINEGSHRQMLLRGLYARSDGEARSLGFFRAKTHICG